MKTHSLILSRGLVFLSLLTLSTSVLANENHSGEVALLTNDKLVELQNSSPAATLQIVSITPYTYNGGINIRCWGQNTGRATVLVSGGTAPYSYMWSGLPSQTSAMAVGMYAGTYTVIVTDATGASVTGSITLIQNPPVQSIATPSPILCYGGVSLVTVTASGGTTPISGLNSYYVVPGTYYYTVADANGCRDRDTITVTEPPILDVTATPTPILCFGGTSQVTVAGTGGTFPYSGTGVFDEVAGSYTYVVTDANGCTDNTTLSINEPGLLVSSAVNTPISCFGEASDVTVTVLSGSEPYSGVGVFMEYAGAYEYVVIDNNGCIDTVTINITQPDELLVSISATAIACSGELSDVSIAATGGSAPYSGTGTFSETAGTYTYTVTDANGCAVDVSTTISQPTEVVVLSSVTSIDCSGGSSSVTVTATGGIASYIGTGTFSETAGSYTYAVTDANGCTSYATVVVTEPSPIQANLSPQNQTIDCIPNPVIIDANPTGGLAPYSFIWSDGSVGSSITVNPNVTTTYSVTITDANGCSVISESTVTVQNRCGKKNHKVVICHVPSGNPNNAHTICISQNALNSHLANAWNLHGGDYCGPCNAISNSGTPNALIVAQDSDLGNNSFIRVAINTNTDLVELSYRLTYYSKVKVEIYDMTGSLVEVIHENKAVEGELYDISVNPSKFTSGVYIYQFITDKETHIDKIQFVK